MDTLSKLSAYQGNIETLSHGELHFTAAATMENNMNRCNRGVFAVCPPAELSTSHFSVLEPDSSVSFDYDQTLATERSSLQLMETTVSEVSFDFHRNSSKFFEGCRRGVFALGPKVLKGDMEAMDVSKEMNRTIGSSKTPKRSQTRRSDQFTRQDPILHREMSPAEAWESGVCRRGVFADAMRQLWEPLSSEGRDDVSFDTYFPSHAVLTPRRPTQYMINVRDWNG